MSRYSQALVISTITVKERRGMSPEKAAYESLIDLANTVVSAFATKGHIITLEQMENSVTLRAPTARRPIVFEIIHGSSGLCLAQVTDPGEPRPLVATFDVEEDKWVANPRGPAEVALARCLIGIVR